MSTILDWITNNWAFVLLTFGGESLTIGAIVCFIVKLVIKRADKKANEKANAVTSTAVVSALRLLHGSLHFLQGSIELIINNSGSETIRARYSKLKEEAENVELEINTLLDRLLDLAPETIDKAVTKAQQTVAALKEVIGVDTNQTVL